MCPAKFSRTSATCLRWRVFEDSSWFLSVCLLSPSVLEVSVCKEGLWDRGALPEEDWDLVREYRAVHEENFFSSWLMDDTEGKAEEVKERVRKGCKRLSEGFEFGGCNASPSTARHSHLWGARNPRVLRSSTSNLDDPCDSGREHGRSGPNPGWRLGAVHESLAHWLPVGIQAQSIGLLCGSAIYLRPARHALGGAWCGEQ